MSVDETCHAAIRLSWSVLNFTQGLSGHTAGCQAVSGVATRQVSIFFKYSFLHCLTHWNWHCLKPFCFGRSFYRLKPCQVSRLHPALKFQVEYNLLEYKICTGL
jgi:hypothetical protein